MTITSINDRTAVQDRVAEFRERLAEELGTEVISTDPKVIRKLSSDWSRLSPILMEKLPPGRFMADLVVRPASVDDVPRILRLAYEHDVPVTPRGAGTGNYGQATPFAGGLLLDLRRLDRVVEIGGGFVRAEAGARLTAVDRRVREAGHDIWMFPSTKNSSIGGFIAGGSAGTGTIKHGTVADGWIRELRVAPCDGSGTDFWVGGPDTVAYTHAYGVSGIVTEVVVRTDPAREWLAFYASFPAYEQAVEVHRRLPELPILPRLASADEPPLVPSLPAPIELDPGRTSLRIILEPSMVETVSRWVAEAGGEVVGVLEGYEQTDRLSGMSYNHPIYFRQRAGHPCFHLEVNGRPLWDDPDAVKSVYPNSMIHLELGPNRGPFGMLAADYESEAQVLAGFARLNEIGIDIHSPHQWNVDRHVEQILATVPRTDPKGLLNPGKLHRSP
ncbi:FAD-binding oxidoreductase [Phytoactinopolyspora halotolerans]|uniref:FAD-binding oxidoreductase n=1 Tax=Phytoactinopolyspora halotolerans TaxID=1981512 RepID=A0A6L9SGF5_9ACTN|nr:FAD-binding oxidoreductase [Phytoactinopolyspora halotolerans]NEE04455.1 FAD-binding oxidoreductase [Phytoactinopolyspora halotolerans]